MGETRGRTTPALTPVGGTPRVCGATSTLIGLQDGARKTQVERDGSLILPQGRVTFGVDGRPLGTDGPLAQKLLRGYLPAVVSQDTHGDLAAGLLAFTGRTAWGPVDFVRVRLRADRGAERTVRFTAGWHGEGRTEAGHAVSTADARGRRLLVLAGQGGGDAWTATGVREAILLERAGSVSPQNPMEFWLVLPWDAFPSDLKGIEGLDGEEALEGMIQEWETLLAKGTNLELPDEEAGHDAKAALAQLLILRERDTAGGWFPAGPDRARVFALREAAVMTTALAAHGYGDETRECLEWLLARQRPDGRFESSSGRWDGIGQAAWVLMDRFHLTRDLGWLRKITPALQQGALWLVEARRSARGEGGGGEGLLPCGEGAGAARFEQAFAPNCWGLLACRLALEASSYLGLETPWLEAEVDEWRLALSRALDVSRASPADEAMGRAVLRAIWPCEVFEADDARLAPALAALGERLDVTGGDPLSAAFTAGLGQARLRREEWDGAAAALGALRARASATRGWADSGSPDGIEGAPAAEFLLLLRGLLVHEAGSTLHLFPGIPRAWTGSGRRIDVKRLPTQFGLVEASLKTEGGDTYAGIVLTAGREPDRLVLHLRFAEPRRVGQIGMHGICADERLDGDQLVIEKPKGTLFVSLAHVRIEP